MTKRVRKPKVDVLQQIADSLTSEEYIRLLDITHPLSAADRAKFDKMSDDELLAELFA